MRDLYAELHVPADAEHIVIRAAFRALARRHHPDAGGDNKRMQAVSEAWSILGRPDRRLAYDEHRATLIADQRATADLKSSAAQRAPVSGPVAPSGPAAKPSTAAGTLDYGRYEGWTIEALAVEDPDYLEWLRRSLGGRSWRTRIDAALAARALRMPPPPAPTKRRRPAWR